MAKIAKVQEVDVEKLKPYERNAKIHSEEQVGKICDSIREFGFISPCLIDSDYNVIAGHGRIMAAQELGMKKVPCLFVEGLTDDQRRAYILADNRLTELGEWDMGLVEAELSELEIGGFDISLTGFDLDIGETEPEEIIEDDVPEPPKKAKSKVGQIYQLGEHRLMCGDSTDAGTVEKLMDGEKADMVFTDPPYGVDYAGKNAFLNAVARGNRIQTDIIGDALESAEKEKDDLWVPALVNARVNSEDKCAYYIASPQGGELMMMMMAIRDAGWQLKHTIIWNKNNHVLGRCDYNYKHEPILYGWNKTHAFYGKGQHKTSVWDIPKPQKSDLHPTMKPIALIVECLQNSTQHGERVLDVFGGSGSTLIACEQTGRKCYMMELDPHYVDVIIERWENLTGKKAVLLHDA